MSVNKMADGKRWYVYVRYKDWSGQTRQHKKEGFARRADAKEYEAAFLAAHTNAATLTVQALYERYMADCQARLRPTTAENKQKMLEAHVLPCFGQMPVSEVSPAMVRQWQNDLMQAVSPRTGKPYSQTYLKQLHAQLSALFNYGVRYHGVKSNPCKQTGSMGKTRAETMQFWTAEEFRQFLAAIKAAGAPEPAVLAFSMLFWSGMRKGELLALTLADFDFAAGSISITKSLSFSKGKDLVQDTKTPKGRRTILMPGVLMADAQAYAARLYGLQPSDRLFPRSTRDMLRRWMKRGSAAAGVKRIRIHDLRHSHASLLIEMGFSPLLIAERLGHESIDTTLQTYSHLYPNKQSELAAKLETMIKCYDSATVKKS